MSCRFRHIAKFSGASGLVLSLLIVFSGLETFAQDTTKSPISIITEDSTSIDTSTDDGTTSDESEQDALTPDSLQDSSDPLISITAEDGTPADLPADDGLSSDGSAASSDGGDEYKPLPYFSPILGLGGGFFTYFGDLRPFDAGSRIVDNLAFDFSISTRTNKYLTMELYFLKGKFTVDEKSDTRNLNFQSSFEAGGLSFSHNFGHWIPEKSRIHPYMSFGIEGFNFNSKGDTLDANGNAYYYWSDGTIRIEQELGTNPNAPTTTRDFTYESDLREANLDGQDRYSQFSFAIPVGVGINYRINRRTSLDLGTEMHFTFTDNLDNISSMGTGVREGEANLERFLYTSLTLRFNIGKDDPEPPIEPEDSCLVDDDNDGVNNCKDECPETPDSVAVDSVGCPVLDTAAIVVADTLKNDTLVADSGKSDTLQKGTLEEKCLWTVVLGKFGKGQFPSADFINQVLSIPGVWTEVSNDTTLYIKELYESPEEAEVQRINIANNTSIKDCRVLLWTKMLECDENVDMDKVRALLLKSDQLNDKDVFLRVQIGAFSTLIATDFFNISDVVMIPGKDGLYKYVTGDFKNDLESAVAHREAMVRKGFEDAFIVVYRGGERVTLEEVGMSQNAANLDTAGVEIKPGEQIIEFKIQIYASTDAIYLVPANFKEIENIEEYKDENLFKYTFGAVSDFGYARDVLLNQMLRIGYKDAFVVAFLNGKRITVEKALELLDQ